MASFVSGRMGDGGKRTLSALLGLCLMIGSSSCTPIRKFEFNRRNPRPKPRVGRIASDTLLTYFSGNDLGRHSYNFGGAERNGIVYTCRAGHLDIAHVRKSMDWTAYLASRTYQVLLQKETQFSIVVNEPARYYVKLTYPADWDILPAHEMKAIARDVSIDLGAYLAYLSGIMHEVFSWYRFSITLVFSEFPSAFSWEDNLSNLLGTQLGKRALRERGDFDETATRILHDELVRLQIQPQSVAKQASKQVEGQWYTGRLFLGDLLHRHFDIGSDGLVEACTIDVPECKGCPAEVFPVPDLAGVGNQGFLVEFRVKPYLLKDKILAAAYPDKENRPDNFAPERIAHIIDSIIEEAEARGYDFVQ